LQKPTVRSVDARSQWLDRMSVFFDAPSSTMKELCVGSLQIEECLDRLMEYLADRHGKRRWAEKTPTNVGAIDRILGYWPAARIVHVVRDPRDVYASMIENDKWTEPGVFADHWQATAGAAYEWVSTVTSSHPSYFELRYERLALQPRETMKNLLVFLNEPWEDAVADFSGLPEDFERVRRATGKESTTLKRLAEPLTKDRIGVWQKTVPSERWKAVQRELELRGFGTRIADLIEETASILSQTDSFRHPKH
jgi:hypothetical protein